MAPLNATRVIPAAWSPHHRPVVAGSLNLACEIWRPGGLPAYGQDESPATLVWPPPGQTAYCRLQQHTTGDGSKVVADQAVQIRDYLAVVPYEVLDLVRTGEDGDVLKAGGHSYTIVDALQGSELWECDLMVQANDGGGG